MKEQNKFMKILIACGATFDELRDYVWEIEEIEPHKYHCMGFHPIAPRISYIKSNVVIH